MRKPMILHLTIGISIYALCAFLDGYLTLRGMRGDLSLEGSPIMRFMMETFGFVGGLLVAKTLVLVAALSLAIVACIGIHRQSNWIYYLALSRLTKSWMKKKRRYWVAFVPLYIIAIAQGFAAVSWLYLLLVVG